MDGKRSSAVSGFYKRSLGERRRFVQSWGGLTAEEMDALERGGITLAEADVMIENVVGRYALPFAVASNFVINGVDRLIPMVIEESSVVAACSYGAKLFRAGGGIWTSSDESVMIGQIQILDLGDAREAVKRIEEEEGALLEMANAVAGSIGRRGGGAVGLEARVMLGTAIGDMVVAHLHYDTRDAMGANAVNRAVEHIAPRLALITGGRVNLRILSNLCDGRKARAEGRVPAGELAAGRASGKEAVAAIVEAGVFAELDPYRAATHNKGIMNGIDGLMLATGNDWRAVEAGAHAYAARGGRYGSLSRWWKDEGGDLRGSIELPLAVGVVGGASGAHRLAGVARKVLGVDTARGLAEVGAAVGLAQNLAALRALATDGIQSGHMRMHGRQLAVAAGAEEKDVVLIAEQMHEEGNIGLERARELVEERKGGL